MLYIPSIYLSGSSSLLSITAHDAYNFQRTRLSHFTDAIISCLIYLSLPWVSNSIFPIPVVPSTPQLNVSFNNYFWCGLLMVRCIQYFSFLFIWSMAFIYVHYFPFSAPLSAGPQLQAFDYCLPRRRLFLPSATNRFHLPPHVTGS